MSTTAIAVLASTWGVVMGVAPLLQMRRMLANRSSRDVSLAFFAVYLLGFVLWLAYGVALGNLALIIPNSVSLVVCALTLAVAIHLRSKPSGIELGASAQHG